MVERIDDNSICSREWAGNDRVNQHHHGRVRLNESPLRIRLYWKAADDSPRQLIGAYEIHLQSLLREGYMREDGKLGEIKIRFQRVDSGDVQIGSNRRASALSIGTFKIRWRQRAWENTERSVFRSSYV